jgi:hypothetical protein
MAGPNEPSDISNLTNAITESLKKAGEGLTNLNSVAKNLNDQILAFNAQLAGSFGRTQDGVQGLRKELIVALPEVSRLGGELKDVFAIQQGVAKELGNTNILLGQTVSDLFVAGKAVGVASADIPAMVGGFRDAGIEVGIIKDRIQETVNVARAVGANTVEVFQTTQQNLGLLNKFGFQNGVEGLSKMASTLVQMRVNMYDIERLADTVFTPEGAIETVAAFQRMGVAVGDLADPFRLMYLASEDMEELTKQMVSMTSKFSYFDEKTKEFKLFSNAKRDLRDLAQATGLQYDSLVKMSFAQTKMNQLSSQFKFSNFDKDDQQLIANFAQFSKAKGDFVVKIDREEKLVTQLNKDDVEKLRGKPETVEEIAMDSLDEQKLQTQALVAIQNLLAGVPVGAKPTQDIFQVIRAGFETASVGVGGATKRISGAISTIDSGYAKLPKLLSDIYKDLSDGDIDWRAWSKKFEDAATNYSDSLSKIADDVTKFDFRGEMSRRISSDNLVAQGGGKLVDLINDLMGGIKNEIINPVSQGIKNVETNLNSLDSSKANAAMNGLATSADRVNTGFQNLNNVLNRFGIQTPNQANNVSLEKVTPPNITPTTLASNTNQNVLFSPINGNIELKVVTEDGTKVDLTNQIVSSVEFQRKVVALISEKMQNQTYNNLPNSVATT